MIVLRSRVTDPAGKLSSSNASPPGLSMRSAHVVPFAPSRFEVNMRYRPSGDQRGLELSVDGDVNRAGAPPLTGATQISE